MKERKKGGGEEERWGEEEKFYNKEKDTQALDSKVLFFKIIFPMVTAWYIL